jgi:hypothetical protein
MESHETFHNTIVDNVLNSPTSPHMTYLVKWNQGYQNLKTTRKCGFRQKTGNRFSVGARFELVPELNYRTNLFRNEVWHMLQFSFTL